MTFYCTRQILSLCFFLFFSILTHTSAAEKADFWVIENPAALVIYNQYEQRLSPAEKSSFSAFSAWQILSSDHLFSDQFTRVIKTRFNRDFYYFQLDDNGLPVNGNQAGSIRIIKNAVILGDTIRIRHENRLVLESGLSRQPLKQGMLLLRLFKSAKKLFVQELDGQLSGWIQSERSDDYEVYQEKSKNIAYQAKLFRQAESIFHAYNQKFEKLFAYLNQQNSQSLPPPKWTGTVSASQLTYRMEPAVYKNRFNDTRLFLLQELKDLLHGSDYLLGAGDAVIAINRTPR